MPELITNKTGGQLVYNHKDWLAGISPKGQNSIIGGGNYSAQSVDPLSVLGVLAPGRLPTNVTNVSVVTGVLKNIIVHNSKGYSISTDGKIIEMDNLTNGALTSPAKQTITPHGHSACVGHDIITYYVGTTKYAFYSWSDNTDGDVGRYNLDATFDDDFMSTVPASAAALGNGVHPMEIGHDDILYIGDGNVLKAFDGQTGANGTFISTGLGSLTLPLGYKITSIRKVDFGIPSLAIFAYKSTGSDAYEKSDAKMFLWDYLSLDPYKIVDIDDYYVNSAAIWNGTPICFTRGQRNQATSSYLSKLKIFDGAKFKTVCTFNDDLPINGGIQTDEKFVSWNSSGKLYTFGSPMDGVNNALHHITTGDGTTSGLLSSVTGGLQVMSSGTTTSGGLQQVNTSSYRPGSLYTSYFRVPAPYKMAPHFKSATVEYLSSCSATSLTLQVLLYYGASGGYSQLCTNYRNTKAGTYATPQELNSTFCAGTDSVNLSASQDVYIGVVFQSGADATSAPQIKTITIDFEYINI